MRTKKCAEIASEVLTYAQEPVPDGSSQGISAVFRLYLHLIVFTDIYSD
jgi:hypothetical protein